ncbi:MAG: ammonium transporter [Oscillospiraceae bacterium]|nr:ammonium transporter [Oscillospiraceae bacterium]
MLSGDIGFMIICSALVLLMTPALAFFYGGFVPRKNAISTMMMSIYCMGIATIMWVLFGFALAFGGNTPGGIIGGQEFFFLNGVQGFGNMDGVLGTDGLLFAMFQMMFGIITTAIISGSVVGKMRFKALAIFIPIWLVLVYYPLAHMAWGGGLFAFLGAIDFAGGNVVHISSGVTGLVLCLLLGKRKSKIEHRPHNIPFILLGAALLLFGWFGFNAGSAVAANDVAVHAFATTAISSACALFSWIMIDWFVGKKPTLVGAATGMVVGLVAITPGAAFVPLWASMIIGLLVSPVCYFAIAVLKKKFGYDDTLDAFGCHGVGGIYGGIMTGLFCTKELNPEGHDGLIFGDATTFIAQIESIGITLVFAVVGTLIAAGIVRLFTKLRASEREEKIGLDITDHGETAYPAFNGLD